MSPVDPENPTDRGRDIRYPPALEPQLVERARTVGTASIHEAAKRIGALPAAIKPVAPVATPPAVAAGSVINGDGYKIGVATWYNYIPGRCATWYLPKGTKITIRDLTTGKAITCIISDREWHSGNHVVDLSETQFAQLAPLWKGVISVKVTW